MDQIFEVLPSPVAWFSSIFFWIVTEFIRVAFRKLPSGFRGYARKNRLARARKISKERKVEFLVFSAISRANANYILFMFLVFGYLFGLLTSAMGSIYILQVFFALPVIGFEIAWLLSDQYAKDLIAARARLTNSLSRHV